MSIISYELRILDVYRRDILNNKEELLWRVIHKIWPGIYNSLISPPPMWGRRVTDKLKS